MQYTREDLKLLQSQSLDDKIDHTICMLENFYLMTNGHCYLSFSGGKDSTVLKHIIQVEAPKRGDKLLKDIPLVFSDTGLEYPEIRQFAKDSGAEFIKPKMNFREVLCKYGYPLISKSVAGCIEEAKRTPGGSRYKRLHGEIKRKDGSKSQFDQSKYLPLSELPIKISCTCCNAMKKRPFRTYQRQTGLLPITASTAAESVFRTTSWVGRGCNSFDGKGNGKSNPLSAWLEQDVLHYIKRENIPICSVYGDIVYSDKDGNYSDFSLDPSQKLCCTGCDRTGCVFCAFGVHLEKKGETKFQRLKKTHPNLYDYMMRGGEWVMEDGKRLWMPNANGLGFAKVFDMVNEIYGKDFYRYE